MVFARNIPKTADDTMVQEDRCKVLSYNMPVAQAPRNINHLMEED